MDLLERTEEVLREGLERTGNASQLGFETDDLRIERLRRRLSGTQERLREQPKNGQLQERR